MMFDKLKKLIFPLVFLGYSSMGWAEACCIDEIVFDSDSIVIANQEEPEHYPSAFNAQKLETAIKTKYIGLGVSLAGFTLVTRGNREAGILAFVLGGVTSLFGLISQDVQLSRLGWKHERRSSVKAKSVRPIPSKFDCADTNLDMGDRISFQSNAGISIEAEIIGIVPNPLGCQIIVAYELNGERRTSTLPAESLTKL